MIASSNGMCYCTSSIGRKLNDILSQVHGEIDIIG